MRSNRTRARIAASIAALFLAFAVAAGWPALVASPAAVEALPFLPILTIKPKITFIITDRLVVVDIPDANLNAALHAECGVPLGTKLVRGDLYDLTGELDLYDKGIQDLEGIQFLKNITDLGLGKNPITHVPTISGLANLQAVRLDGCGLDAIPPEVLALPNLYYLMVRDNDIETIPDAALTHPTLSGLFADHNLIRVIPDKVGASGLFTLTLSFNRIDAVPDKLFDSTILDNLILSGNRLTTLPAKFGARSWENLDFEFNFLDVTPGGTNETMLKGIVAASCDYKRQLTPLSGLAAEPGPDSIRLSWTASPDFGDGTWSAKVVRYLVYRNEGGVLTELALPGPGTTEYTETGLTPSTAKTYTVGVEYEIVDASKEGITRHYKTLATGTTAEATATPEATPGATGEPTPATTEGATPTAAPTDGPGGGGSDGLPTWAILLIGSLGLLVVACGVVVAVVLSKMPKAPKPPATPGTPGTPEPPPPQA